MSNPSVTHASSRTQGQPTARPVLARDNTSTDRLLSYYQSALAGQGSYAYDGRGRSPSPVKSDTVRLQHHKRESSVDSSFSSSSDYSVDSPLASPSDGSRTTATPPSSSSTNKVRRRSSVPSEGGEDRRRLAIVQLDSPAVDSKHLHAVSEAESPDSPHNLRSRRGLNTRLDGLALMAPPDAAARTYTQLTPPPTAPIVTVSVERPPGRTQTYHSSIADSATGHHRSASEVAPSPNLRHKSSRDANTIFSNGTAQAALKPLVAHPQTRSPSPGHISDASDSSFRRNLSSAQTTPSTQSARRDTKPIPTPEIGQEKQIGAPVAPPVVMNLNSVLSPVSPRFAVPVATSNSSPLISPPTSPPASYLHYQPGLHAKAGPLPQPPKAFGLDANSTPPPRPPRLHSPPVTRPKGDLAAVKQALQLPPSVSAVLASRLPPSPVIRAPASVLTSVATPHHRESNSVLSTTAVQGSHIASNKPIHIREGAFPPSAGSSTDSSSSALSTPVRTHGVSPSLQIDATTTPRIDEIPIDKRHSPNSEPSLLQYTPKLTSSVVGLSQLSRSGPKAIETDAPPPGDWVSINVAPATPAVDNETTQMPRFSSEDASDSDRGPTPSPPPKSIRTSWTAGLKRFSTLPRTPSPKSKRSSTSSNLSRSRLSRTSSRSPSPSPLSTPVTPEQQFTTPVIHRPRVKFVSPYPPAMFCGDVTNMRTAVERCAGYAAKINELYNCDCGLAGWLFAGKAASSSPRKRASLLSASPSHSFAPQIRHTSGSSMTSEVTFPRRADATLATDLSFRPSQDLPPTSPPPLPYPSLALQGPSRSSTIVSASPSSIRTLVSPTSSKPGFFASLGRRTSMKKDRPLQGTLVQPPNRLIKSTPRPDASPHPRSIHLANNPSVPGGPRAPPNRMARASTIMISPPMSNSSSSLDTTRSPSVERSRAPHRSYTMLARPQERAPSSGDEVIDIRPDPDFLRQVDKLADLLPHADRDVLAGYLRRAGQDMVAIGQYLEDEKNGTIRLH
ncbi:hypothetical protein ONZ45_g534 [Pleurotus djamor]|nr:hypothetical protein ONZ45_g534 [Pleurotus djamor]